MKTTSHYLQTSNYLYTSGGLALPEVSTDRQKKNGTTVYALEILHPRMRNGVIKIEKVTELFALYQSGYVRRLTNQMYPINKRKVIKIHKKVSYVDEQGNEVYHSELYHWSGIMHQAVLLENEVDRLQLLSNYLDKKYATVKNAVIQTKNKR